MFGRVALMGWLLAVLGGCTGLFFQPMKDHVADPATFGFAYEDVTFEAADGTGLHGWFFPAEGERLGSLLFLHGNAENVSTHFANVAWLAKAGVDVLIIDYRGYGRSAGSPTLEGLHLDAEAALDALIAMPETDPERIAVFGQSLGGAIALSVVAAHPAKDRLAALIVEGAFSDYRAIAREKLASFWLTWPLQWPFSLTIDNAYSPSSSAGALAPLPLLVIHGQRDDVVPPVHGERLFDAANQPKAIWRPQDVGHIQALATLNMREQLTAWLGSRFADR
ncbi:MAG: alpha/beta fold hydrolase [Pseudomonadota bacterium]